MPVKAFFSILMIYCLFCPNAAKAQAAKKSKELAAQILADKRIDTVYLRARETVAKGFNAGSGYGEIWIRDFNTFINASLDVGSPVEVRQKLLLFFKYQGNDGNIADGLIEKSKASVGYQYTYSPLDTNWAAHKNTVETDQETSLIQAVKKYVEKTNDVAFLMDTVGKFTVLERMMKAVAYLDKERKVKQYGLIKGATTVDWGDVQPETGWGVNINDKTKWSIDIYDNAMLLIALHDLSGLLSEDDVRRNKLIQDAVNLKHNIRRFLWDDKNHKYIPHIYLNGSPFPKDFDEQKILYTGGTACAILAGLHTRQEIDLINKQFLKAAGSESEATIGITVYPPYPSAVFPNMAAYTYQNGGDWTWFGGRMIQALIMNGFYREAYTEIIPCSIVFYNIKVFMNGGT